MMTRSKCDLSQRDDTGVPRHRRPRSVTRGGCACVGRLTIVLLGVGRVREALLEDAYNEAVDAGDFEETRAWVEQTTRARRRRRASA